MAGASLIAGAASGAMNTVGAYYAASGQKNALKLQARLDEINAKIADSQARDALFRGERAEQAFRQDVAQLRSKQRVGYAAGGVDLGSETVAATLTSTDVMSELDATQIKANALREAWGMRTEAGNLRSSANMNRATASAINPLMQAGATFLTEGAKWGGQYAAFKDSGAIGGKPPPATGVGKQGQGVTGKIGSVVSKYNPNHSLVSKVKSWMGS
jgi:hypothetical protein